MGQNSQKKQLRVEAEMSRFEASIFHGRHGGHKFEVSMQNGQTYFISKLSSKQVKVSKIGRNWITFSTSLSSI